MYTCFAFYSILVFTYSAFFEQIHKLLARCGGVRGQEGCVCSASVFVVGHTAAKVRLNQHQINIFFQSTKSPATVTFKKGFLRIKMFCRELKVLQGAA